jgi:hypothetical protein
MALQKIMYSYDIKTTYSETQLLSKNKTTFAQNMTQLSRRNTTSRSRKTLKNVGGGRRLKSGEIAAISTAATFAALAIANRCNNKAGDYMNAMETKSTMLSNIIDSLADKADQQDQNGKLFQTLAGDYKRADQKKDKAEKRRIVSQILEKLEANKDDETSRLIKKLEHTNSRMSDLMSKCSGAIENTSNALLPGSTRRAARKRVFARKRLARYIVNAADQKAVNELHDELPIQYKPGHVPMHVPPL